MPALRGFSMRVHPSSMVSLVGRNGAGKTTLMRSIMGHLRPARGLGAVRRRGSVDPARAIHARHSELATCRKIVAWSLKLTVEENILLPLWVARHLDRKVRLDFVYEVIGELAEMRQRKALLLSGGQQKLVALDARSRSAPDACCSTSLSRECAGAVRATIRGPCLAERQGPHPADVPVGYEPFTRTD